MRDQNRVAELLKGSASFVPGYLWLKQLLRPDVESDVDTHSLARYSYSVWLRHLSFAHRNHLEVPPRALVEIGPGRSLGVGIAALLSGATDYVGLDVVPSALEQTNLAVLDGLATLFRGRERIPDSTEFPLLKPYVDSYDFPEDVLDPQSAGAELSADRVEMIREALVYRTGKAGTLHISYHAPWHGSAVIQSESVDMVIAQAVMQYIPNLREIYWDMYRCLRPGGFASLQIDYSSLGATAHWDGHWEFSDVTWRLMRGKKAYILNRHPHAEHIRLLREAGFEIVQETRVKTEPQAPRRRLGSRFAGMSDEDRSTSGAFIQARKPWEAASKHDSGYHRGARELLDGIVGSG